MPIKKTTVTGQTDKQSTKSQGIPLTLENVNKMIEISKEEVFLKAKDEITKQVQTDRASLITVFGLFASIVLLVTMQFKFLEKANNIFQIIGLNFNLLASLLSFNIALDYLVKSRLNKDTPKPIRNFYIFVVLLFFLGISFISISLKFSNHIP